jgi:hypothetical protein
MKRVNLLAAGMLVLGQLIPGVASAASVTLSGHTVDFSFDDSLLGLFGQPTVAGDSIYFTPINFTAESMNGDGFDLTKQTINIKVTAHDGWDFSSLDLTERGDYLRVGGAKLAVTGQIRAFDSMNPMNEATASILNDEKKFKRTHDFVSRNWSAGATADLAGMRAASMINVTLENILVANSLNNRGLAFIEKKFAGLEMVTTQVTTPVPEADTYAMMLAGLGLVGWSAMRRRKPLA